MPFAKISCHKINFACLTQSFDTGNLTHNVFTQFHLLVDTFSRLIVGFHIGMESPSYVTAMRAVKTVIEDWRFIESELDLEFEDQYFHQAVLPDTLHADRGELLGHQVNLLSMMHSIILEFSPPFHAVSKAIVERHFRSAQADFKQFVPGVVENTTVKKR